MKIPVPHDPSLPLPAVLPSGPSLTVVEALKRARALIESGWTQGTSARDDSGVPIPLDSPNAVQFCLTGALRRACYRTAKTDDLYQMPVLCDCYMRVERCLRTQYRVREGCTLEAWNDRDGGTQAEVLALIEEAIAGLK